MSLLYYGGNRNFLFPYFLNDLRPLSRSVSISTSFIVLSSTPEVLFLRQSQVNTGLFLSYPLYLKRRESRSPLSSLSIFRLSDPVVSFRSSRSSFPCTRPNLNILGGNVDTPLTSILYTLRPFLLDWTIGVFSTSFGFGLYKIISFSPFLV